MTTIPMNFLRIEDLIDFRAKPKSTNTHFVKKLTVDDLFECIESNPEQRFELINGQIIVMSNASLNHNTIMNNFVIGLGGHLRQGDNPCRLYSDTNCKINHDNYFQPDFAVICHKPSNQRYLENPVLVGEILSSNRKNDVAIKLPLYQKNPSIQEILYLEQKTMQITVYHRNSVSNGVNTESWQTQIYKKGDTIHLQSVDFSILVDDFYIDVDFN